MKLIDVKIISVCHPSRWYADKIGETFQVVRGGKVKYQLVDSSRTLSTHQIDVVDAKELHDTKVEFPVTVNTFAKRWKYIFMEVDKIANSMYTNPTRGFDYMEYQFEFVEGDSIVFFVNEMDGNTHETLSQIGRILYNCKTSIFEILE